MDKLLDDTKWTNLPADDAEVFRFMLHHGLMCYNANDNGLDMDGWQRDDGSYYIKCAKCGSILEISGIQEVL